MASGDLNNQNSRSRQERRGGLYFREVVAVPESDYSGIGAELRATRERLNIKLSSVADALRINLEYLQAIEGGQFQGLPGHVYTLGFLRSYAEYLELDPARVISQFKEEDSEPRPETKLDFPEPMEAGRLPTGRILLISLIVAAVAYTGWFMVTRDERRTSEIVAAVPERLAPVTEARASTRPRTPVIQTITPPAASDEPATRVIAPVATSDAVTTTPRRNENTSTPVATTEVVTTEVATADPAATDESAAPNRIASTPVTNQVAAAAPASPAAPAPSEQSVQSSTEVAVVETRTNTRPETSGPATPRSAATSSTSTTTATAAATDTASTETASSETASGEQSAADRTTRLTGSGEVVAAAPAAASPPLAPTATAAPARTVAALPPPLVTQVGPRTTREGETFGAANTDARIVLVSELESWIQVRSRGGEILLTRVLRPGDRYLVPDRPGLVMMMGNAGAIRVMVDGEATPAVGPLGAVRRNVELVPSRLIAGTAGE